MYSFQRGRKKKENSYILDTGYADFIMCSFHTVCWIWAVNDRSIMNPMRFQWDPTKPGAMCCTWVEAIPNMSKTGGRTQADSERTWWNSFKPKGGRFRLHIRRKFLNQVVVESLEKVFQRTCGCSIHGGIQGQVGWYPRQPDPVAGNPANGRGIGTRWSLWPSPP